MSTDGMPKTSISFTGVISTYTIATRPRGVLMSNFSAEKKFLEFRKAPEEITGYLKMMLVVKFIEMYECEWERMKVE